MNTFFKNQPGFFASTNNDIGSKTTDITIYYGGDDNEEGKENNENSLQIEEQDVALITSKITSRLEGRGIPFEEEKVIAAIIENHTQSRPQMEGLNEASVVYETEGNKTVKFLGLFKVRAQITAIISADQKYGTINRLKLTPLLSMAIISVLYAILEVKNITVMKVNNGENSVAKYGMKLK